MKRIGMAGPRKAKRAVADINERVADSARKLEAAMDAVIAKTK